MACYYKQDAIVHALLQRGAFVNSVVNGEKPIDVAINVGHIPIIKLLIQSGSEIPTGNRVSGLITSY